MSNKTSDPVSQASHDQVAEVNIPANIPSDRLLALLDASDEMMRSVLRGNRKETLNAVARCVHRLLNAEACAVFLTADDVPYELVLEAHQLDKMPFAFAEPIRLKIQKKPRGGLTGFIAHDGEVISLHGADLRNHPSIAGKSNDHLLSGECFSVLGIPLMDRKRRLLGVVKVDNKKGANGKANENVFFNKVDESVARILLNKIVLVLESMRTFDSLQRLMKDMHQAQDLKVVLDDILVTSRKLTGADRGDFVRWNDDKHQLITDAEEGSGKSEMGEVLPEKSITYEVWSTRKPVLIMDIRTDPTYRDKYHKVDQRTISELAVCLEFQGRAIGVLNLESKEPNCFDEQDQQLLQLLAQYATMATQVVGRDIAFRDVVQRLAEHAPSQKELLTDILRSVANSFGFDAGIIYIAQYDKYVLHCSAVIGCEELTLNPDEFTFDFDKPALATKVFLEKTAYFSFDPIADRNVDPGGLKGFQISGPLIGVPLIYRDKVVGVLVSWSRHRNSPTEEHKELLKPFARVAATVIAVSESEQQRTKVLSKIGNILTEMQTELSAARDLRLILELILSGVIGAGFDQTRAFKWNEETESFTCLATAGMDDPQRVIGYTVSIYESLYTKHNSEIWHSNPKARCDDISMFGPDPYATVFGRDPELPWATVPLVINGKLYGYITADNKRTKRKITGDSLEYLTLYGALAGQAIANREMIDRLRASKIKDDFLQQMGHTFGTVTSTTKFLLQNLKDGIVSQNSFNVLYLPGFVRTNERLLGLVQKIRDFAALREDTKLNLQLVDLVTLVTDVMKHLQAPAYARGVKLEFSSPLKPVSCELDITRAASAVEAILENAIKFSLAGKTVHIRLQIDDQEAQVIIRDEGTGIPEEDLRLIFDSFYRGRNAKEQQVDGTGLGLSIVRLTMELHGGKANVRNYPGGGAEFTLVFPRIRGMKQSND